MEHIAQGKRSDTLGFALSCQKRAVKNASTNGGDASRVGDNERKEYKLY